MLATAPLKFESMMNLSTPLQPNIVFLVVESTDGRTWQRGYQDDVIPLPNIRALQEHGVAFHRHYSNAPVCCPSRATFWSGRHAHKIPHTSRVPGSGLPVDGAWNNFEGLPPGFDDKMSDVLARHGYSTAIFGKRDWTAGAHTLNVQLNSWTMYTQFPYSIDRTGGWADETMCQGNGSVRAGGGPRGKPNSAHEEDWKQVAEGVQWIADNATAPFFVYQGMNIVHPPYLTNEYWYDKIDESKVRVPRWLPLEEMHPCDLQASMLKGCIGSAKQRSALEDEGRRRRLRRIYYSMVAEFDDMVGAYMDAVRSKPGAWESTIWIVTSDHGDMQFEHRQFYKMVPREPSANVPMVIFDGRPGRGMPAPKVVNTPTQLIDIFPTVMEYAGVDVSTLPLDGASLAPLLTPPANASATDTNTLTRAPFVTSQFHGCNLAMSWFLIVQLVNRSAIKYIVWGTGAEAPPQLFNLTADPGEFEDLLDERRPPSEEARRVAKLLDSNLRATIDYPVVAQRVAHYNLDSFRAWANHTGPDWPTVMRGAPAGQKGHLRWTPSWDDNPDGSLEAVHEWLARPARIMPCRKELVWPPREATTVHTAVTSFCDAPDGSGCGRTSSAAQPSTRQSGASAIKDTLIEWPR